MHKTIVLFFFMLLPIISLSQDNERPNIIFILADDLGSMDVGVFAEKLMGTPTSEQFYETPNIDQLANEGIAFSQAYANPLCSPTRASLLTGIYASRLGFSTATAGSAVTFYNQGEVPPPGFHEQDAHWGDDIQIPQALTNGYTKIAIPSGQSQDQGQDQITIAEALKGYQSVFLGKWHVGGHGSKGYQPKDQGFEELAYFDSGSSLYFNWRKLWNKRQKRFPKMRQDKLWQGKAGELSGEEYLTDDLTERAVSYIQNQKTSKHPFLLYLSHFAVHLPLQAMENDINYFENKSTRGWNGHKNAEYAAMIKRLDNSVGEIMQALEKMGLDENTLVVFMSDNGGVDWERKRLTNNDPLKGGKAMVYEGGIRVPLIFWWKDKVQPGSWINVPVDANDIFPTLVEVAGYNPEQYHVDGQSLVPLFQDVNNSDEVYSRDIHIWHYPLNVIVKNPDDGYPLTPHSAIRKGDYKLIFDWHGRLKLYNIKQDISENVNLAFKMPNKTKELFAKLVQWLELNVDKKYWPKPNPDYNSEDEVRDVPFVNLYHAYKAQKNIILSAN